MPESPFNVLLSTPEHQSIQIISKLSKTIESLIQTISHMRHIPDDHISILYNGHELRTHSSNSHAC